MRKIVTFIFCLQMILTFGQIKKSNKLVDTSWKNEYESMIENYYKNFSLVIKEGKYGFVNKDGKITVPIIYDNIYGIYKGYARIKLLDKFGWISIENNKIVVPVIYDWLNHEVSYGFCEAALGDKKGYLKIETGNVLIPIIYDHTYTSDGFFIAEKNGEVYRYNSAGKCIEGCENKNLATNLTTSKENAKTNPNVTNPTVKSSNQLSKEAKDVYNISKSKQFDKFNTTEVVYNKITYQVKLVKQPGIDIIIINKYKEGIGFTNSCIINKSNLKPIFDFGKYLVLGRIFKVSNENHYYIPISSINPISDDVKKRSGLYDLTYNEEVFKPNEFYSIDYPFLLDHEANELAPDYYVLELPLNTLQLSQGDIYDNYYLYNIKDKNIISNRSSDVKKNNYKTISSSNTSSNYEIIEQNNISEIKVLDENANESSSISISIGCNNYRHNLDKENEGFNIVYTSNSKSFSSNKDLSYLNSEIDNKIIYREGGIATISFIADNGKTSFLKIKFNRGGSYRLEIYGKKY